MLTTSSHAGDIGALLSRRLAGFAGFLHANGFCVGGADAVRIIETATRTGALDRQVLRWSLRALLCANSEEWQRFDGLFDAYFLPPNKTAFVQADSPAAGRAAGYERQSAPPSDQMTGADYGFDDTPGTRHGASREEALSSVDFRDLNKADEARAVEALMRRFARRLKHLYVRREVRFHRGRRLDLQGTIRQSVASGGTPLTLAWKQRRSVRPRLLLLLDVSRSMSAYSFFYLRLARALCTELKDVHCHIFHTRITNVGEPLRDRDPWRAQERLHVLAVGWGGGTRIGECLRDFNRNEGARLVHSRTGIIVVSDGYDTGEPDVLAEALAVLRRRARRIVWLNPLLSLPDFAPVARGMQAAMPYIDLLAPGGNLAAVERALPRLIESLQ